MSHFK